MSVVRAAHDVAEMHGVSVIGAEVKGAHVLVEIGRGEYRGTYKVPLGRGFLRGVDSACRMVPMRLFTPRES